jgi:hypothetical protein
MFKADLDLIYWCGYKKNMFINFIAEKKTFCTCKFFKEKAREKNIKFIVVELRRERKLKESNHHRR